MSAFTDYLRSVAAKGELVNLVFEERLFELVGVLHRITEPLASESIPHEVIGGLAVLIHVEEADPTHSTLTRDVDIMIRRSDLEKVKEVAQRHGFRFRHAAGLDMLVYGEKESARNAVHLLFSGERVRSTQPFPNPQIAPVRKSIHGRDVYVISLPELLRMKLSSFRDKDRVHVRSMDAAGLITEQVERTLPIELIGRLRNVRETE